MLRPLLQAVLLSLMVVSASAQKLAIEGGRLLTDLGSPPGEGTVLIEKGRIVAAGADVKVPEGARSVDAHGLWVVPAFIDVGNQGLVEPGSASRGPSGAKDRVAEMVRHFDSRPRRRLLRAGVGVVYLDLPPRGRANKGPTGAVALVDPETAGLPLVAEAAGVSFRVGGSNQGKTSVLARTGSMRSITAVISAAERYKKSWEKYEKEYAEFEKKLAAWKKGEPAPAKKPEPKKEAEKSSRPPSRGGMKRPDNWDEMSREERMKWLREQMRNRSRPRKPAPAETEKSKGDPKGKPQPPAKPKRDAGSEAVVRVLDGKARLRVEAHWKEDIRAVLKLAKEKKIGCVLLGATEAWRCLEEIKEAGATVALASSTRLGGDPLDAVRHRPDLARRLAAANIPFAFTTAGVTGYGLDSAPLMAGLAVGAGLEESDALRALTTGAARVLGLEDELGALKPGYRAAIQLLSGPPLAPDTRVVRMVIGDSVVEMGERQ